MDAGAAVTLAIGVLAFLGACIGAWATVRAAKTRRDENVAQGQLDLDRLRAVCDAQARDLEAARRARAEDAERHEHEMDDVREERDQLKDALHDAAIRENELRRQLHEAWRQR
jgi:hypothetical protein